MPGGELVIGGLNSGLIGGAVGGESAAAQRLSGLPTLAAQKLVLARELDSFISAHSKTVYWR